MRSRLRFCWMTFAAAMGLCSLPSAAEAESLPPLVSQAKSDYRIVIAGDAAEPEKFAAAELARYVERISGARLAVSAEAPAGEAVIQVGSAAPHTVWLELSQLSEDAFVVRTAGRNLILSGGCPRSTLYAVYAYLEMLGVGFPRPGQSHLLQQLEQPTAQEETIPRTPTIPFNPVNRLEKPSFEYRGRVAVPPTGFHRAR